MGISFDAPLALLLLIPALLLTIGLHLGSRRRMGSGRRTAALVVRALLLSALVFALAGFQLVLPVDRLATVFVVDLSDSVGNAGREDALAFLRETLKERPDGDVAGIVAFGKGALVERLPAELTEIDRLASAPVRFRDRYRRCTAARHRTLPRRRGEADRPAFGRQRHDWRRSDRGRPGGVARRPDRNATDRPWRCRRGADRAVDDAVDGTAGRGRAGGGRGPLDGGPDRDCPPLRQRDAGPDQAGRAGRGPEHDLVLGRQAGRGRVHPLPCRRRGRPRHVQRERSRRLEHDRQGRAADPGPRRRQFGRGRARRGTAQPAPAGRHDGARGAPDRSRQPGRLRQRGPRRCLAAATDGSPAGGAPGLRPRPRQGPGHDRRAEELRGRWLREDAARGDPARRHGRAQPGEAAGRRARRRDRPVGLDGGLPLQQLQRRHGRRRERDRRRPEGRHRQGGDPASRGRPDGPGRARRGRLQRGGALGHPDPAARRDRRHPGPDRGHPSGRPDEYLRRPRPGGDVARRRDRDPAPHHPV